MLLEHCVIATPSCNIAGSLVTNDVIMATNALRSPVKNYWIGSVAGGGVDMNLCSFLCETTGKGRGLGGGGIDRKRSHKQQLLA